MSAVSGEKTQNVLVAPGGKPPLAVPRRLLKIRSDSALAERFAAGDETAFDVLYERHRPVVLAVSMGVLGTTQDAEDATQETFSALAVALRTKPPAEMRPWLIRVARNASIDTTRRRRHRLLTLDGEIPDIPARPTGAGQAELAMVLDGIRDLPEGQRMALLMRELGGHTYCEIAEFLETDEEAVKGLIARARVGLRTYREATELPCATARSTIAAEPDGRRYDKTIRRHLRTCPSCRSYRAALRSDAKTLRAALPLPAGGVATGGLSTGALAAAKGAVLGYGITQAAATCAASVCAVGAVGGMVFIAPVHKFGVEPILPAAKPLTAHHQHKVNHVAPKHVVAPAVAAQPTVVATPYHAAAVKKAVTHTGQAKRHVTTVSHHRLHRASTVTVIKLPSTLATHQKPSATPTEISAPTTQTPAAVQAPTQTAAPTVTPALTTTPPTTPAPVTTPATQTVSVDGQATTPDTTPTVTSRPATVLGTAAVTAPTEAQAVTAPIGTTSTETQTDTTSTDATATETQTDTTPTGTTASETDTTPSDGQSDTAPADTQTDTIPAQTDTTLPAQTDTTPAETQTDTTDVGTDGTDTATSTSDSTSGTPSSTTVAPDQSSGS